MSDWKKIDGYDNYEVSRFGRVKNMKTGDYLNGTVNNSGYLQITLRREGKPKQYPMHRLVALAFLPNPDKKQYVRHYDEDNLNNDVFNLYWQSYEEFIIWGDRKSRGLID